MHARGDHFLHGLGDTNSWETSINDAIEKIEQQLQKVKGKWQERKRRATSARVLAAAEPAAAPGAEAAAACAACRATRSSR